MLFYPIEKSSSNPIRIGIFLLFIKLREPPIPLFISYTVFESDIVCYPFGNPPWSRSIRISLDNVHHFMGYDINIMRILLQPIWTVSNNATSSGSDTIILRIDDKGHFLPCFLIILLGQLRIIGEISVNKLLFSDRTKIFVLIDPY